MMGQSAILEDPLITLQRQWKYYEEQGTIKRTELTVCEKEHTEVMNKLKVEKNTSVDQLESQY